MASVGLRAAFVVDGDAGFRRYLSVILSRLGYAAAELTSPAALIGPDAPPAADALYLLTLSDGDAIEAIYRIGAAGTGARFILFSEDKAALSLAAAYMAEEPELGIERILQKPVTVADLAAALEGRTPG